MSTSTFKTIMLWLTILVALFLVWHVAQLSKKDTPAKFSDFMSQVEAGAVKEVTITGNDIRGKYTSDEAFRTTAPLGYEKLVDALLAKKVNVTVQPDQTPTWANMLISWAPFILLIGFWIFFMRQMQSGGNKALSFGKSKAKLLASQQKKVTFKDVAGVDEAKEELQEIIEFLREPQKFQKLGGRIPKGVLLMGPPGTGKTLLARAIAGEANVPFFSISGSDFVEMFVGVGASRVRDLFEQGKKNAPCIIFIDEIDAVGRHRGRGPRRRPRRARADPEPAPGGDGRLRVERRGHPHRRHQPARRARSRAAAARPLRPPGGGLAPRRPRPRGHPAGPHPQDPALRRRGDRTSWPAPPPASRGPTSRTW